MEYLGSRFAPASGGARDGGGDLPSSSLPPSRLYTRTAPHPSATLAGFAPITVWVIIGLVGLLVPALLTRLPMLLVIGGVVGLAVVALVIACPYVGLLLFLALLYLRPEDSYPVLAAVRMTLLASLLAFGAWLLNALLCRERVMTHLPVVACFLSFLAVAVGSTALSGCGELGEQALEMLKLFILFTLIIHLVNSERRLRRSSVALILLTAALGARTIWEFQRGEGMMYQGELRALGTGIFADPNDLALAMAMALPLALWTALSSRGWWTRGWSLTAGVILVWTIFVTNSRGGMVALCACLMMFFGRRLGWKGVLVGTVAILVLMACGPSRLSQMSADEDSAQGRVLAWEAGLRMLRSSPIWGVGKAQFVEHHGLTAHNSLVLCMAELGLAGTAGWIGLFYFIFRDSRWLSRQPAPADESATADAMHSRGAVAGTDSSWHVVFPICLVTYMVGAFFLSRTYTPPLYVYFGLAVAAVRVEAERRGLEMPAGSRQDFARIAGITLGSVPFVMLLVRLWS
jgi:putative inorganic carbon (hco3(-)) transporter